MKCSAILFCACVVVTAVLAEGYRPPSGYVPDSGTAVQIAEAVLIPVYGKKEIESERPFTAKLEKNTWIVNGTLRCPDGKEMCFGGVAVVKISKTNARIVYMMHGK